MINVLIFSILFFIMNKTFCNCFIGRNVCCFDLNNKKVLLNIIFQIILIMLLTSILNNILVIAIYLSSIFLMKLSKGDKNESIRIN